MRCVWLTWSLLTSLSAILCGSGCLLPYWIKGSFNYELKEYLSDVGLFRRCTYPVRGIKHSISVVLGCGHYWLSDIPHLYWKICLMMLLVSTSMLFFLTFLLFILGFCVDLLKMTKVYKSCQAMQFIAGVMVLLACILYPFGWHNNTEITQICGRTTSILSLGRCTVGWAFVLTCAGGLIALLGTTIPALLLRNGCHDVPQCQDYSHQYEVGSMPSTARDSMLMRYGSQRPLPPQQHLMTNGTRYSYVSYQSLLASSAPHHIIPNQTIGSGQMVMNSNNMSQYPHYLHPGTMTLGNNSNKLVTTYNTLSECGTANSSINNSNNNNNNNNNNINNNINNNNNNNINNSNKINSSVDMKEEILTVELNTIDDTDQVSQESVRSMKLKEE